MKGNLCKEEAKCRAASSSIVLNRQPFKSEIEGVTLWNVILSP